VYVDKDGDLAKALPILINSKVQRPSVCNAAETLLVHKEIASTFLPAALTALHEEKVVIHGDAQTIAAASSLGIPATLADEENWSTEYGVLEMNVRVVDDVIDAAEHIRKYGTNHTEAIISENPETIEKFINQMDAAAIMINASTRFTDGEEMGFGAEIGISNQKAHARGPMGLEEMTTTTWIVTGTGQIRR
jgi:glutamate-5-semialdehyde dehydrogenase